MAFDKELADFIAEKNALTEELHEEQKGKTIERKAQQKKIQEEKIQEDKTQEEVITEQSIDENQESK